MDSRDAGVPDAVDGVSHCLRGKRSFFSDRDVARAGGYNCDRANALIRLVAANSHQLRGFMPLGIGNNVTNLTKSAFVCTRDENVWRALNKLFNYSDNLRASLTAAKDNLGKALARGARVIDARESDVFKVKILDAVESLARFQLATLES